LLAWNWIKRRQQMSSARLVLTNP